MTTRAAGGGATPPPGPRPPWPAVVVEVFGALAAAGASVLIPLHRLATRVAFFGEPAVVHEEDVRVYWTLVAVLASGVAASLVGSWWRRGRRALFGHVGVGVVGALLAASFSVTVAGPIDDHDDEPPDRPRTPPGSVCHSGGDSAECAGG